MDSAQIIEIYTAVIISVLHEEAPPEIKEEETQDWADVVASDNGKVRVPMSPHRLPPQKRPERERLFAGRVGSASEISTRSVRLSRTRRSS